MATSSIGGPSLLESGDTNDFEFDILEAEQTLLMCVISFVSSESLCFGLSGLRFECWESFVWLKPSSVRSSIREDISFFLCEDEWNTNLICGIEFRTKTENRERQATR